MSANEAFAAGFVRVREIADKMGLPRADHGVGHQGSSAPPAGGAIGQAVQDLLSHPFESLLGRRTYDIWAAYWPRVQPGHRPPSAGCTLPTADPPLRHSPTHECPGWGYRRPYTVVGCD